MASKQRPDSVAVFLEAWDQYGFDGSDIATEHVFDSERGWRFDVAFPSLKVGIEIDGFGFGHQSIKGREADNDKQNAAIEQGWTVLRYSTYRVRKCRIAETVEQVCNVLMQRAKRL